MKIIKSRQLNQVRFYILAGLSLILAWSSKSVARKLDWSTGYYQITAKTSSGRATIDGLSTYQVSLRYSLLQQFEVSLGYSVLYSQFLSGDMGYGPDLGVYYFPLSSASSSRVQNQNIYVEKYEPLRPFIVVQFQQRQFQSIETSYAGFSAGVGLEYWTNSHYGFKVWTNATNLSGPSNSNAYEKNFLMGVCTEF